MENKNTPKNKLYTNDFEKVAFNKFYVEFISHSKGMQINSYLDDVISNGKLRDFLQKVYDGNAPFINVIKIGAGLLCGSLETGKLKLNNKIARDNAGVLYRTELGEIYTFPKNIPHDISFLNGLSSFISVGEKLVDVNNDFLDELDLKHSSIRCLAAVSELEKQAPFMFNKLAELMIQLMSYYNFGFFNLTEKYLKDSLSVNDVPNLNITYNKLDFGWLVSHYPIEYPDSSLDTHTSCIDLIFENYKEIVESCEFNFECERFNELANKYLNKINLEIESLMSLSK